MKQELNAAEPQLTKKRVTLTEKMERKLASHPSDEDIISEGNLMDYTVELFDNHSLAQPSVKAYQHMIDSMLFLYQTDPSFVEMVNINLAAGFDLNSIQLKLCRLSNFFKSLSDDGSSMTCIEYRRLNDMETTFTESDLESIKNQMYGLSDFDEDEEPAV